MVVIVAIFALIKHQGQTNSLVGQAVSPLQKEVLKQPAANTYTLLSAKKTAAVTANSPADISAYLLTSYGVPANTLQFNTKTVSGKTYITADQSYQGIPIFGARSVFLLQDGKLIYQRLKYYQTGNLETRPTITAVQSTQITKNALRALKQTKGIFPPDPNSPAPALFSYGITGQRRNIDYLKLTEQMIDATDPTASLVYYPNKGELALSYAKRLSFKEIPAEFLIIIDASSGKVIDFRDQLIYESVHGSVSGKEWEDPFPSNNQQTKPTVHENIYFSSQTVQTNGLGSYQFTLPPPGTLTASLQGSFVNVLNYQQGRAAHTTYLSTALHNWDWSNYDTSYMQAESNVFYHVNRIHDYATTLGITEMNFPIDATVNYWDHCNAHYSPNTQSIMFYSIGGGCEDMGLISDVIYHEYGHGINHALNPALNDAPYWDQPGNLDEGISDYWACTTNNNPNQGEGFFLNNPAPLRICNSDDRYPEDYNPEPHTGAQIISGALWDTQIALGTTITGSLLTSTLRLQPLMFEEMADAMIVTDNSVHINQICHSFYDLHGVWSGLCAGHTQDPQAFISSPTERQFAPWNQPLSIIGTAFGGSAHLLSNYKLYWGQGTSPTTWSEAGMTLTNGGTQNINENTLATFNTGVIAQTQYGYYTLKLVATFQGEVMEKRVVIFIAQLSSHCGQVFDQSYTLTEDWYCDVPPSSSAVWLFPSATGVTFDCNNHFIRNVRSEIDDSYGIWAAGSGMTIKRCIITNFHMGIIGYSNFDHSSILDNQVFGNRYGIGIWGHPDTTPQRNTNLIKGNLIANNLNDGILMMGNDNTIEQNTIENTTTPIMGMGIEFFCGSNNIIRGNTIRRNEGQGIWLYGWFDDTGPQTNLTLIENNNIYDNGYGYLPMPGGIVSYDSPYNTIRSNTFSNNSAYGIAIIGRGGSIIRQNTVNNNLWGIGLYSTSGNIVENNIACRNRMQSDLYCDSGSNSGTGNKFRYVIPCSAGGWPRSGNDYLACSPYQPGGNSPIFNKLSLINLINNGGSPFVIKN